MRRTWFLMIALVAALAVIAGCSDDDSSSDAGATTAAATDAFPVTIPHAFGETTIDAAPERVVTWGWGSADAAIALGTVPVAIPSQTYGGDADGVLPWIREALEADGAEIPAILPESEEPPYEDIANAKPDLILAPYSGITKEQYELLTAIAPTVAYPEEPWATPWQDTIRIVGTALGKSDQAETLLADIDARFAAAAEANPVLEGKTVAMVWDAAGTFYVYKPADPRVQATEALGLVSAPSVEALAEGGESFYYPLSYEQLDGLESDILVSFADTQALSDEFLASAPAKLLPQVEAGTVAQVVGKDFIASVSPPTALSLTWGLDDYVEILAAAAEKVDAP